jgi:hypothetical protein
MIDLTNVPVSALLALHGNLLAELRRRSVVRSANNPTGDYGALLFSRAFGWTLNSNSSADADAIDGHGIKYQIKCRRLATPQGLVNWALFADCLTRRSTTSQPYCWT